MNDIVLDALPMAGAAVGPIDVLIAASAVHHDLTVLHYDGDFELLAEADGRVAQRWVVPRGSVTRDPGGHTADMAVSEDDRRRMDRLANALAAAETDQPAEPGALAEAVAWANQWRGHVGLPLLAEEDRPPEEEFYRRARALGLRRRGS